MLSFNVHLLSLASFLLPLSLSLSLSSSLTSRSTVTHTYTIFESTSTADLTSTVIVCSTDSASTTTVTHTYTIVESTSTADLTPYTLVAQLPALQIENLSSLSLLDPNLSISDIYLDIYCPRTAKKPCLALRGEACPGAQTVVYYHIHNNMQPRIATSSDGTEKEDQDGIRIEELPGHEGALSEAARGKVVLLATGPIEDALRGGRSLGVGKWESARDGSSLRRIAMGGDIPSLFRALYQRQTQRVALKNQRFKRRVRMIGRAPRSLYRWVRAVEEEARRVWQEGQVREMVEGWLQSEVMEGMGGVQWRQVLAPMLLRLICFVCSKILALVKAHRRTGAGKVEVDGMAVAVERTVPRVPFSIKLIFYLWVLWAIWRSNRSGQGGD